MPGRINRTVLMSDTAHFRVEELNPYSHKVTQPDTGKAAEEHRQARAAVEAAGIKVVQVPSPAACQDGVYVANWALCRGNKAVMARLPNLRQAEEPYAKKVLESLGKEVITVPDDLKFSGQGDALPCGDYLLCGSGYRTDPEVHGFLAKTLGYNVVSLHTVPLLDANNAPVINKTTGWPDGLFYDIDLAISVLTPNLIAWCPEAFVPESQDKIAALPMQKIEVSKDEAVHQYACNLLSTDETVIMNANASRLRAAIEAEGLKIINVNLPEIAKGGGYIRCSTLTIDNN